MNRPYEARGVTDLPYERQDALGYSMTPCFEHSWQSSYSKSVSYGVECYEGTIMVLRPPKLDTTAMGRCYLIWWILIYIIPDHWTCICLVNTDRSISCWLPGSNCETWTGFCDHVRHNIFSWIGASRCLEGDDHHYRSILTDHLHPMLQTLFLGERAVFRDNIAPVHTSCCVQTWIHEHDEEVEPGVLSPLIYHWAFVGLFREKSPCSVSSSMHTIWIQDGPVRGIGANSNELCSKPLFVNPIQAVIQAKGGLTPY